MEAGVIHVHGKGNKDRRIPLERALIHELEAYLAFHTRRHEHAVFDGIRVADHTQNSPGRHHLTVCDYGLEIPVADCAARRRRG